MKLFKENISLLSSLISIITVIVGWVCNALNPDAETFTSTMSTLTIVLLVFIFIVDQKRFKAESKNKALQVLAKERRVFSLNYVLLFEYLQSKNRKNSKPNISYSNFTYYIYNVRNKNTADIVYDHEFGLKKHNGKFDPLIMYATGELVEEELFCVYKNEKIFPMLVKDDSVRVSNANNNRITHFQFELKPSSSNLDESLELHYRNKGGHFMSYNDVFTILPRNYGKTFSGKASFCLKYNEVEHPFSVSLYKLPYYKGKCEIIFERAFKRNEEGTEYICKEVSIDVNCIYFIVIEKEK